MLADYKSGTYEKRLEALEDMIYEQLDALESSGKPAPSAIDPLDINAAGHMLIKHADPIKDEKLLERIISEGVGGASFFTSPRIAYESLYNAVLFKAADIINWQMKDAMEFSDEGEYYKYSFDLDLLGDTIGKCFYNEKDKITELNCRSLTVVLQRNQKSPCGFFALTAYPCRLNAEPTGREFLAGQLIENQLYNFKSIFEKTAYVSASYINDMGVDYLSNYGIESIRIRGQKGKVNYVAYINEDGQTKVRRFENRKMTKISVNQLDLEYHEMKYNISWMEKMVREGVPAMKQFMEIKRAPSLEDTLRNAGNNKTPKKSTEKDKNVLENSYEKGGKDQYNARAGWNDDRF